MAQEPTSTATRSSSLEAGLEAGLAAVFGPLVIWSLVFGLGGLLASPDLPPDQCHGIGFGCRLSRRETLWIAGAWLGLPVVAVVTTLTILSLAVLTRSGREVVTTLLTVFFLGSCALAVFVAWPTTP